MTSPDPKPVVARESEPVELAGNDSPLDGVGDDGGTVRAQIDVGLDEVDPTGAGLGQQAGQPEFAQEDDPAESAEIAGDRRGRGNLGARSWWMDSAWPGFFHAFMAFLNRFLSGMKNPGSWIAEEHKAGRGECQSQ